MILFEKLNSKASVSPHLDVGWLYDRGLKGLDDPLDLVNNGNTTGCWRHQYLHAKNKIEKLEAWNCDTLMLPVW